MANGTRCSDLFRPPRDGSSLSPDQHPPHPFPTPGPRLIPKAAPSLSHLIWSGRSLDRARYHILLAISHSGCSNWMCPVKPATFEHCKRRYGSLNPDVLGSAGQVCRRNWGAQVCNQGSLHGVLYCLMARCSGMSHWLNRLVISRMCSLMWETWSTTSSDYYRLQQELLLSSCFYSEPINMNSYKKHLSMELKCLFQYIVNQPTKGLGTELLVLEDAMSGSETLRLQGVKKLDWDHGVYQTRMQLMFVWQIQ
nr:uncharacterized protein LOC109752768 isoform X3 [Aegilops tauschii subsp. strangulata]